MDIHEYQAKVLLRKAGIPVPPGEGADTPAEAEAIAKKLGGTVVVKAQVHAGGRGKAGGVQLAKTAAEARDHTSKILGMEIKGLVVQSVLVTHAEEIATAAYLGVLVDRKLQAPLFMASPAGGIDIEEVARSTPEKLRKLRVDPRYGLLPHQAYWIADFLYDDPDQIKQGAHIAERLWRVFIDAGASMVEINPLITTPSGEMKAIDAKLSVDDNELFRHLEIADMRDTTAEPPAEMLAREANLSYVKLDGTVGCCVNGAGLAMATMDLVSFYGGEPANFLDIGGSSNPDKVVTALEIITADANVKVILFNIFGGIPRCDDVAKGIIEAMQRIDIKVPIVIRLTGTNEDAALEILKEAGCAAYTSMDDVVKKAVDLAGAA